jgi:DNA-binding CsgD family transcriptional regulator
MTKYFNTRNKTDIIQLAQQNTGTVFDTLNQSTHSIWWAGPNGQFLMGNNTLLKTCGFRNLDHLQGSHYSESSSECGEFHQVWQFQDTLTCENQGVVETLSYIKYKGFEDRVLVHGIKNPAYDSDGKWIGTVNHGFDMTNSKAVSWLPVLCAKEASLAYKNNGAFTFLLTDRFVNRRHNIQLTKRQSECLFLLLRGLNIPEIADVLRRSKRTVEDHLECIRDQLNAYTRSEIISAALNMGFVNLIPKGYLTTLLTTLGNRIP